MWWLGYNIRWFGFDDHGVSVYFRGTLSLFSLSLRTPTVFTDRSQVPYPFRIVTKSLYIKQRGNQISYTCRSRLRCPSSITTFRLHSFEQDLSLSMIYKIRNFRYIRECFRLCLLCICLPVLIRGHFEINVLFTIWTTPDVPHQTTGTTFGSSENDGEVFLRLTWCQLLEKFYTC